MSATRVAVLALLAAGALLCAPGAALAAPRDDPALAAYRAFARSPDAGRLLAVARAALAGHWDAGAVDTTAAPAWPGPPTGLYVSLVGAGRTRACVGSPTPPRGSLADCVRALAVAALASDPRRPPVRRAELAGLRVVIAFAGAGESVSDPFAVDPGREGLLVSGARGHVAFLPGEARTVSWALREARRLGVLDPAAPAEYARFPVVVVAEPETNSPPGEARDEDE